MGYCYNNSVSFYHINIINRHGHSVNKQNLTVVIVNTANTSRYGHIFTAGFAVIGDEVGYFNLRLVGYVLNNALYLRVEMVCLVVR